MTSAGERPAIVAEGLVKRFGPTLALAGLDLAVPRATVLGVLGPNGAGKTTAVRIFTTLLRPDEGRAEVAGFDVLRDPEQVRASIGLTGQFAAVDGYLSGRENLEMVAQLYHLSRRDARARAGELLERFDLADAANRPAKTYSGGMSRRLDLAASLVVRPPILFLDEPTTGLDPRSRIGMWDVIRELVREGTTLLLTTQYLEEADSLADTIAVIDGGRVIAGGTADQLKDQIGGDRLEVAVPPGTDLQRTARVLEPHLSGAAAIDPEAARVTGPTVAGSGGLAGVVRDLDAAGIVLTDLVLRRPTLDDVFLALTGHGTQDAGFGTGGQPEPAAAATHRRSA